MKNPSKKFEEKWNSEIERRKIDEDKLIEIDYRISTLISERRKMMEEMYTHYNDILNIRFLGSKVKTETFVEEYRKHGMDSEIVKRCVLAVRKAFFDDNDESFQRMELSSINSTYSSREIGLCFRDRVNKDKMMIIFVKNGMSKRQFMDEEDFQMEFEAKVAFENDCLRFGQIEGLDISKFKEDISDFVKRDLVPLDRVEKCSYYTAESIYQYRDGISYTRRKKVPVPMGTIVNDFVQKKVLTN